jgi:hypothetical protein
MELYKAENVPADIERIKADVDTFYAPRLAAGDIVSYEITAEYQHSNWFEAQCVYVHERFGEIKTYFTVLILNGELKYQNNGFDYIPPVL